MKFFLLPFFKFILSFSYLYSQNFKSEYELFNKIINYTPKEFKTITNFKYFPSEYEGKLSSIALLSRIYQFQKKLKLTVNQIHELEERIDQLSLSFYLENNPILIEYYGGYSGCNESPIAKKTFQNKEVMIIKFCHTCSDQYNKVIGQFIDIFNFRTNQLLKTNNE
ncbi:hypothetical protein ACSIGC_15790 [Tenacibaculum sp. ZS6-P6]|uniref:hypothetical protein n=1 Tax=Tenacibaculum sp. ZS6-P6 TaxID=3447503 RepID=UPI003F96C751